MFFCNKLLKHSHCGHQNPLEFLAFPNNKSLCVERMFEQNERYQIKKHFIKLPISYQSHYKTVSEDTICGWIKHIMEMAGINVKIFTAHTMHVASTSYAMNQGVPIKLTAILTAARWSQESAFV